MVCVHSVGVELSGVEFRVRSKTRPTETFLCLELVARSMAVVRVKIDERHVLERNELTETSGGMEFTLDVYILTTTASLDY